MKRIELSEKELAAIVDHIEGRVNPNAPTDDQLCLTDVIEKAEELEREIGQSATDEIMNDPDCDIIRWYYNKYKQQQETDNG